MKTAAKLILWCALFAALTYAFYRFAPVEADAYSDEATVLTVLTDDGPASFTMAEYLPGVIAAEMPVSFGLEALKAQAVAARTYILSGPRHENADVCTDSACCLAYMTPDELRAFWGGDFAENMRAVAEAVRQTDGQYLTYDGGVIEAVFHASSAGATEDSAAVWSYQPYLVSVASPETSDTVPELITTVSVSPAELAAGLGLAPDGDPALWLGGTSLDAAGRVQELIVCGAPYSGKAVRSALGLKSTAFSARWDGAAFIFTVAGNGHGVGMSQYGAKLLAAHGWTYDAILAHYYPGTELAVAALSA